LSFSRSASTFLPANLKQSRYRQNQWEKPLEKKWKYGGVFWQFPSREMTKEFLHRRAMGKEKS